MSKKPRDPGTPTPQMGLDFTAPPIGVRLRDAGIASVLDNSGDDFRDQIVCAFAFWLQDRDEFVWEDFRKWWTDNGGEQPHTHNFWGALCRMDGVAQLIECTGRVRQAKSAKTHAHRVLIWRRRRQ